MKQLSIFIISQLTCFFTFSQAGALDSSFDPGSGPNSYVTESCLMPNGKIVLVGEFTTYQGVARKYITRVNADGSNDATFNIGSGPLDYVYTCAAQTDGKLIAGGNFTNFDGTVINRIVRLNADGSVDPSFNVGSGFTGGPVTTLAIQPDGKIIVGGQFLAFDGNTADRIVRLNSNGSIDTTFNTTVDGPVRDIALLSSGEVIIVGNFFTCNGSNRRGIAKLNADGTLSSELDPGEGPNNTIRSVALQSDGKVIVGGDFNLWNNVPTGFLTRLNVDGTVDSAFNLGDGFQNWVYAVSVQSDNKIIAGGSYTSVSAQPIAYLVRLNANGTIDNTWNISGTGVDGIVYTTLLQPNSRVIIGGYFGVYNSVQRNYVARLNLESTVSVEENELEIVRVYPNPTSGELFLDWKLKDSGSIRILDVTGQEIEELSISDHGIVPVEINGASGVYLVEVTTNNVKQQVKVIKE